MKAPNILLTITTLLLLIASTGCDASSQAAPTVPATTPTATTAPVSESPARIAPTDAPTAVPIGEVRFQQAALSFSGLFSRTADFHLDAVSSTPIQTATLTYFYFSGAPYTKTLTLDSAQTQLALDLSTNIDLWAYADGLSRVVAYRWLLTDVAGRTVTSPRYTQLYRVRYTEHDWQVILGDNFFVYYYEGGEQMARNFIMRAAEEVYPIVTGDWGIEPASQINVHVYSTRADYLHDTETKWSAGYAPPYEIVLSPINSYANARLIVGHELTHNIQRVWTPFNMGPSWFAEGIAAYEESKLGTTRYADTLTNNVKREGLLPLSKLTSTASKDDHVIEMIYAEGYGVITYLLDTYGKAKLLDLLHVMGKNTQLDKAMQQVYGKGVEAIEAEWRDSLK